MRNLFVATLITLLLVGTVEAKINDGILVGTIQGIANAGGEKKDQVLVEHAYKLLTTRRGVNTANRIINTTWPGLITADTRRYAELEAAEAHEINAEVNKLLSKHRNFIEGAGIQLIFGGPPAGP